MKWRRKHQQQQPPNKDKDKHDQHQSQSTNKSKPSTFSLSNFLLPLSWFHKLRSNNSAPISKQQLPKPNTHPNAPISKHKVSSPSLPSRSNSDLLPAPRRLSVGDDDSHLARSRAFSLPRNPNRHLSLGSELDFRSDFLLLSNPTCTRTGTRTRTRSRRRKQPPPTETDILHYRVRTDPDLIRSGRKSFSGRIRPKVRVYSPRLANLNPNPNPYPIRERVGAGLERFAVVKKSSDPVRDFRESMVEMIWEKGIGRPDELESLLACYLSLNSEEHHDVIVKVFRQVWFEISREAGRVRVLR